MIWGLGEEVKMGLVEGHHRRNSRGLFEICLMQKTKEI